MEIFSDVLSAVIEMAADASPYSAIVFGSDPPINGLCMIPSGGMPPDTDMGKGMIYRVNVLLNGKHEDQLTVLDTLTAIHTILTKVKIYPNTDNFQILNIATTAAPSLIGREENKQWIYGSSLEISFYWR